MRIDNDVTFTQTSRAQISRAPVYHVLRDRLPDTTDAELSVRQIRQNTRQALQRVVCMIAETPVLRRTPQGISFAQDLIGHICFAADMSDTLFGSHAIDSLRSRLLIMANGIARVFADPGQDIEVQVIVKTDCGSDLADLNLKITHELVANAVKHSMRRRSRGKIAIALASVANEWIILTITDDGAGLPEKHEHGHGLKLVRDLAATQGGTVRLRSLHGVEASVAFPRRRYVNRKNSSILNAAPA